MSRLSLQTLTRLLTALTLLCGIATIYVSYQSIKGLRVSLKNVNTASSALRNHLEGDMMHDALRGDVYNALYAGSTKSREDDITVKEALNEHTTWFQRTIQENLKLNLSNTVKNSLNDVRDPLERYASLAGTMVELGIKDRNKAIQLLPEFDKRFDELETAMEETSGAIEDYNSAVVAKANSGVQSSLVAIVSCVFATVLFVVPVATILNRRVHNGTESVSALVGKLSTEMIPEVRNAIQHLAKGDLTFIPSTSPLQVLKCQKDEFGRLSEKCNTMVFEVNETVEAYLAARSDLNTMILELRQGAQALAGTSNLLAHAADESGNQAGEMASQCNSLVDQAAESGRMMSTVEQHLSAVSAGSDSQRKQTNQMKSLIDASSSRIAQASEVAHQLQSNANEGTRAVEQTLGAMTSISGCAQSSTLKIRELEEMSARIGAIVNTISGIAEQTNLLALNAAIEAARAGEHGRGFAVVADEVRKLAEQSSDATDSIESLIEAVQTVVGQAVEAIGSMESEVANGTKCTESTARVLSEFVDGVAAINSQLEGVEQEARQLVEASAIVASIADQNSEGVAESQATSQQLSSSLATSSSTAEETSQATERLAASAEQVAAAAQEVSQLASSLNRIVDRFQTQEVQKLKRAA